MQKTPSSENFVIKSSSVSQLGSFLSNRDIKFNSEATEMYEKHNTEKTETLTFDQKKTKIREQNASRINLKKGQFRNQNLST